MVCRSRLENNPLHLDSTEAGIILQILPGDPPGPPHLSIPHQHNILGIMRLNTLAFSKARTLLRVTKHFQVAPNDALRT